MKGYDDREMANIMLLFGHFDIVNKDGSIRAKAEAAATLVEGSVEEV